MHSRDSNMATDNPSATVSMKSTPKLGVGVRIAPYLLLAILALVFFSPLVGHPTDILYSDHSDFIIEHVPAKRFLVESWRETGQLPQWCPYNFGGVPFLHDTQLAAFYPPHGILHFVPASAL